ncbi:MAG: thiolase family protein [Firmicutes bacterium]|nr:thiolase family protein [Bacillota bacterium]
MRTVDIIGAGMIPFGKHANMPLVEMGVRAAVEAIKDAGVQPSQINIAYFANMQAGNLTKEFTTGQAVMWGAGVNKIPIFNVENACTSGASATTLAMMSIASGEYDIALVVGAEKLNVPTVDLFNASMRDVAVMEGAVVINGFAQRAVRHMYSFGTTPEQLAMVDVKNRRHASMNPLAMFYKKPVTLEEVLNAPMMADPLTKFSCCANADGAAALVLCASDVARQFTAKPVHLKASVLVSGLFDQIPDMETFEEDQRASRIAYEKAGVGPEDVDLAECHDAFTICEVMHTENLGFCPIGEGGRFVESGATSLGGKIPMNVSGGLLGKGHPLGATAVSQIVEGVRQLRGECGERQVEGAKVFLSECMGAELQGDAKTCTVNILQK